MHVLLLLSDLPPDRQLSQSGYAQLKTSCNSYGPNIERERERENNSMLNTGDDDFKGMSLDINTSLMLYCTEVGTKSPGNAKKRVYRRAEPYFSQNCHYFAYLPVLYIQIYMVDIGLYIFARRAFEKIRMSIYS